MPCLVGNLEAYLIIPKLSDIYNSHMNEVDYFDQVRALWTIQREPFKSWKSLFAWCLDVTVINACELSARDQQEYLDIRIVTQDAFGRELYTQLFQQSEHDYVKKSLNCRR